MVPKILTRDVFSSTFLVTNIHCPSCVSYATDVLSVFSDDVCKIETSVIDHTIRVQHRGNISRQIAEELVNAAFEVEHVTVTDFNGKEIQDFDVNHANTAMSGTLRQRLFMSKAQKMHIKNCNACQEEMRRNSLTNNMWATMAGKRKSGQRKRSTDLESGALPAIASHKNEINKDINIDGAVAQDSDDTPRVGIFSIEGMTCASCVSNVTTELQQLEFVQSVDVNLVTNSAKVVFRGAEAKAHEIQSAIEDTGYGAEIEGIQLMPQEQALDYVHKLSLSIGGMTCGSCVGTISRGLEELDFINSVNIDLVGNSASIEFRGKENVDTILEKLEDLGYDANIVRLEDTTPVDGEQHVEERTIQIRVDGMYCPKCPSNITTAILNEFSEGVRITQPLTLKQPWMVIVYRPALPTLTIRRIILVINSVDPACSAAVYHPPSLEERSRTIQRKERARVLRHLFATTVIVIPTFIIGIVFMDLVPAGNSTRRWFEQPIWAGNVTRDDWALFIMTTPVMFYGANIFHTRALREIWTLWRPKSKVPISRRFYKFGSMNLLISAGTSVAYFASLAVLIMDATSKRQSHDAGRKSTSYFDTVTFLTFFILIGRFIEAYSKAKTGDAVSMLAKLKPNTALLLETEHSDDESLPKSSVKEVSVDSLEVGDVVSVPHGACPPNDGIVSQEGTFLFDESSLTGESRPVKKTRGDGVFTGTVNIGDPVQITVTKIGGKSMLDQIINVVREGQAKRAPIERWADTLTGYFTPVITMLAIITWIVWLSLGVSGALPHSWLDVNKGGWAFWSVEFAIAVFVVACPCGIGLAAPTALFVGGGIAAKNGILVQGGGEAFQEASRLDAIVFDKTGTLTEGQMKVTAVEFLDKQNVERQIGFAIAKSLEEASTHPIAKAIVQHCNEAMANETTPYIRTLNVKEVPGQGMSGTFEVNNSSGRITYEAIIGNERLLKSNVDAFEAGEKAAKKPRLATSDMFFKPIVTEFQSQGNSTAILALRPQQGDTSSEYSPVAIFAISDPLREEASSVLSSLRSQGLEVYMCTGDNLQTAQSIASQLPIPVSNIRAEVLPQDKASFIKELQNLPGHPSSSHDTRRRIIAFVGDGTNDTPALTVADVSIALSHSSSSSPDKPGSTGGGSDIAMYSSSFILLNSNLCSILTLVKLSRRVFLRVKSNFLWAAIYNVILIPVSAGVFFPLGADHDPQRGHGGFRLSPVWASVAMAGSSISVVLSSLALRLPEIELRKFRSRS